MNGYIQETTIREIDTMTLDDAIKQLEEIKKQNPKAGKMPLYAGDTNIILLSSIEVSSWNSIILSSGN